MRKILFNLDNNAREEYPFSGFFHQWISQEEAMFAVIELENGTVEKIHFSQVKFAEPHQEAKPKCKYCDGTGWKQCVYSQGVSTCQCRINQLNQQHASK